jgi:glycosyltransferase involved in cell wall biosynthesis
MRILALTPLLPDREAANAGAVVMYHHLAATAERHEVTLATLAGPDPWDMSALKRLQTLGIAVHAVWRSPPSALVRAWSAVTGLAVVPDAAAWAAPDAVIGPRATIVLPERSLTRQLERRWGQLRNRLLDRHPFLAVQLWEPRMQDLLDRLLTAHSFDLIQVEDGAMGSYRYETRAPRALIELEVRNGSLFPAPSRAGRLREAMAEAERRRWERFQPAVWRTFDRIQVFTARDAGVVAKLAPEVLDRVRINPFAVELPNRAAAGKEEANMLVFVGGFLHPPNVDAALWLAEEIMPRIRARQLGARLTIVGSSPPPRVRALAGEHVEVTGRVPRVEPYLERAAVVLAPVRTGGGMRLKVLQAMALGKAVVTTPLGAEGLDAPASEGALVLAPDAEAIAGATIELLRSDDARRALGERARAFVAEHHSWHVYGRRLERMFAELSEGHARGGDVLSRGADDRKI